MMSEKEPLLQGHTDSLDESASDEVTTKLGGQIQHGVLVIKVSSWAKLFRINPEFRISRLTFH